MELFRDIMNNVTSTSRNDVLECYGSQIKGNIFLYEL